MAYQNFCQEILGRTDKAVLEQWHADFMRDCIEPIILAKGEALLAKHRAAGDVLLDYHRNQPIDYRAHCSALGGLSI